jgi:hypothetical protein
MDFSIWIAKDKREIPISELSDNHLDNIIKFLIKKYDIQLIQLEQDQVACAFDSETMASYCRTFRT